MHGTMLPPPLRSPALLPLGGTFQKKHHLPTPAPEPPRPISAQLAKSSSSQPPGTLLLQAFCPLSPLRHYRPRTAWVPSRSGSVVSAPGPQSDDTPTASRPTGRGPRPPNQRSPHACNPVSSLSHVPWLEAAGPAGGTQSEASGLPTTTCRPLGVSQLGSPAHRNTASPSPATREHRPRPTPQGHGHPVSGPSSTGN